VWIALFRGINVGGKNVVPMAELRKVLTDAGLKDVKTYIQSGNAVFDSDMQLEAISDTVCSAVKKAFDVEPRLILLPLADMESASAANPFGAAEADPKTLHLYFMAAAPMNPDLDAMEKLKKQDSESFRLIGKVFYFHAPDGIGRSKLAERAERLLGVAATGRNWRSVAKILELAKSVQASE